MNWIKNLFREDSSKRFFPAQKTIFLIREYKSLAETNTKEIKVEISDSGYYISHYGNLFLLRADGALEPQDGYCRWLPKSGWSRQELLDIKMIKTEECSDLIKAVENK